VHFTFDPAVFVLLGGFIGLYARAVAILRRRGYEVPGAQQLAWYAGVALSAVGLLSPVDYYANDLLVAHMGQHLLIADLSAPLLLVGLRSPVYAFILPRPVLVRLARATRLRDFVRWLRQPLVAIPVWVVILYGWHFSFMFEAAIRHPLVHVIQHESFVLGAMLVWWSVIEPKRRRLPGDLWKVPYLIGSRLAGVFLGMAFILMRSVAYPDPYARTAPEHGWSAITDQQVAGGMMMGLDLLVMLFALSFFFYRSAQDHDRAERTGAPVPG
jgi:cytochrome c oxidase assembly factor CtaG